MFTSFLNNYQRPIHYSKDNHKYFQFHPLNVNHILISFIHIYLSASDTLHKLKRVYFSGVHNVSLYMKHYHLRSVYRSSTKLQHADGNSCVYYCVLD